METNRKEGIYMKTACENCNNYVFDEDYGYYVCDISLDEDEAERFVSGRMTNGPYYRSDDDYQIVRHQN